MLPYYSGIIDTAVALKIFVRNEDYDETIKDENGVPTTCAAKWVEGQEWRFISFDETRLTNSTHGQGANHKGRTNRTWTCGPADDAECVGLSHATRSMSVLAGSNGKHESLPPWCALACENLPRNFRFSMGPSVIVNGVKLRAHGSCNKKGSINTDFALAALNESIRPMLQAYGGTREDLHALLTCDCVGPHMTLEFLERCYDLYIDVYPRTPNLSQVEQFEDLR